MEELENWIETELPTDGEWWHSGYKSYIKAAKTMLSYGISEDEIKEILQSLYYATIEEYGN